MFISIGYNSTAQIRFMPGKIIEENSNPYKQEMSMLEQLGFPKLDTVTTKRERLNAMDYLLQKRPGVTKFDESKKADNTYMLGVVGVGNVLNDENNNKTSLNSLTYNMSLYYGRWFNTVSGVRFGINLGVINNQDTLYSKDHILTGNISVDYIMNLSNFILDYNQHRRLNLYGFAGIAGGLSHMTSSEKSYYGGARLGFQLNYRISNGLDFYLEPGINIFSDGYNLSSNWRKYDLASSFVAGVTYTMVPVEQRVNLTPFISGKSHNIFVSIGGGWSNIMFKEGLESEKLSKYGGYTASFALGKWLTPVSGVRLSANISKPKNAAEEKLDLFSLRADYLLGLSSLFEGYNEKKPFKINFLAGVESGFINKSNFPNESDADGKVALGFGIGVQGDVYLTKNLSLYVEPRLSIFQSKYLGGLSMGKFDLPASVEMGLIWHPASDYITNRSDDNQLEGATHWTDYMFVSGAIGAEFMTTGEFKDGISKANPAAALYIGKQFNKVFSSRLGFHGAMQNVHKLSYSRKKTALGGISADVLLNMNSLMSSNAKASWITFQPFIGYGANFLSNPEEKVDYISSIRAGLNISKAVNKTTRVFIEPGVSMYSDKYNFMTEENMDIVPAVFAGVTYQILPRSLRNNTGSFITSDFWDNTFVTVGGGLTTLLDAKTIDNNITKYLDPRLALGLGKWFNAHSALRLMATGQLTQDSRNRQNVSMIGLQADYLLNINSLFNEYDASRMFSMYGVFGLDATIPRSGKNRSSALGAGLGFQANFKLSEKADFFIEPRLDIFQKGYMGGLTYKSFDVPASVMIGFNFNRSGEYIEKVRKDGGASEFRPHAFLSLAGGVNSPLAGQLKLIKGDSYQGMANGYLGYNFTSISGVRLGTKIGLLGEMKPGTQRYMRTKVLSGDLSYLYNITNALYGYDVDRRFSASAIAGISLLYNTGPTGNGSDKGVIPGADLGFQLTYYTNPNVGIFVEPKVSLYNDKLITTTFTPLDCDLLASVMVGVNYRLSPVNMANRPNKLKADSPIDNSFVSLGGGVNMILSSHTFHRSLSDYIKPTMSYSLGKWFNEYSGVRLSLGASFLNNPEIGKKGTSNIKIMSVSADYLYNIHNLMYGYDPERIFNMYGLVGVSGAFSKKARETETAFGMNVGFQGNLKLTPVTSIYLEPKLGIYNSNYARKLSSSKADVPASLTLGLTFTRNTTKDNEKGGFENKELLDNTFVSVGGGVNAIVSSTLNKFGNDAVKGIYGVSLGKWLSPISGVKLSGFAGSIGELNPYTKDCMTTKVLGVDLDYMFDVTNFLMGYSNSRLFSVNAFLGASALYNSGDTQSIMGGNVGLNAAVRVNKDFSLFVEPKVGIYNDKLEASNFLTIDADIWSSVMVGLTYNINGGKYHASKDALKDWTKGLSVYGGYGVGSNLSSKSSVMKAGQTFNIGVARELTPISTIRLAYKHSKYPGASYKDETVDDDSFNGIDFNYMANMSNFVGGVDNNRIVTVSPFIGVSAGAAKFENEQKFAGSINGGINVSFKIVSGVELFVEPRLDLGTKYMSMYNNHRSFDMSACGTAGIKYKFNPETKLNFFKKK